MGGGGGDRRQGSELGGDKDTRDRGGEDSSTERRVAKLPVESGWRVYEE